MAYPPDETIQHYVVGFVSDGLFDLLAGRGKTFATDALMRAFNHRMGELFAEGLELGVVPNAPATSLDALPPDALERFGQRCWAMTVAMANDLVGAGGLCGDHSWKL